MGSERGAEELLAYDYNGDGVINDSDVDADGNKALDNLMLMANNQDESVGSKADVDAYKTAQAIQTLLTSKFHTQAHVMQALHQLMSAA